MANVNANTSINEPKLESRRSKHVNGKTSEEI